ncbi:MAG: glyoxalase [Betaproteobacteria bacterium]|jgi:catechol 2,3-dioxygenase-like lactoylglutathione lyase family enzyme|nr:glyoxalase [Betaproteobacteria bacterium]NBP34454.1 glyoxalase [Betaproteobacteria bacterium]NBP39613.1 glyoxalase [Betaproteobacteria bacterium]NBQ78319.1 glyoxalase [Betaproteobacteria bacterium]NBQ94841.1 glyoxalase [Betaproteobacteria bacterium]
MICGMNHFTITAEDREKTLAFYCGLLGLEEGPRPDFSFPGAWLYVAGQREAVLHIYWDRPMPANPTGVIDHMAFSAKGLRSVKERFDASGIPYELRQQAGTGLWQCFSTDPNGARVELDFSADETL